MKLLAPAPFVIGIDPGTNTGIGIWRRKDGKIIFSSTKDFYSVQLFIARSFPDNRKTGGRNEKADVKVFIERPPRILYGRNNNISPEQREDIISKCGGVRREAELLHLCLTQRGYECQLVPPVNEPKWSYEKCSVVTGSKARTSEHERDAIRLAIWHANWREKFR